MECAGGVMVGGTDVTWRCAKRLGDIDASALRTSSVTLAEHAAKSETDESDPVATLGALLVSRSVLDVVYGGADPDGNDATAAEYYVEIVSAPNPDWVGFARVSTAWTSVPPHVRRGTTMADVPEHRRARPVAFGASGRRAVPPIHRDPVALAAYGRSLAYLQSVA